MLSHREVLQNIIRSSGPVLVDIHGDPSVDAMLASLTPSVDRFAEWRWKTIATVTKGLIRLEVATRSAIEFVTYLSM